MPIQLSNIRSHNGSQHHAFEMLCCQLAKLDKPVGATEYTRVGTPDGGVECYWSFADGSEWGWQAKFFLSALDDSQFSQLDKSIRTTLGTHPNLVKYYVCLPRNLSDGRSPNKGTGKQNKTEQDRWNDHKAKWQQWANEKGKSVEFVLWGEQELINRLSQPTSRGFCKFWFNRELFTSEWFMGRVNRVIKSQEGKRFHPDIDVELDLYNAVRILGRDRKAIESKLDIVTPVLNLHENMRHNTFFNEKLQAIDELKNIVVTNCTSEALAESMYFNFEEELAAAINESNNLLEKLHKSLQSVKPSDKKFHMKWHEWSEPAGILSHIEEIISGQFAKTLSKRILIIKGDAGQGKTHLLCSLAQELAGKCHPLVLTLGQTIDAKSPWESILSRSELDFSGSRDEFLGALSASADADNKVALIMIDALNESENRDSWQEQLGRMLVDICNYPNIFMVVSVRSSYSTSVLPDNWFPDNMHEKVIVFEHQGFLGSSYEAVNQIFAHFGLYMLSTPHLLPEWTNPLFVILVAEMLRRRGEKSVPPGLNGINEIHKCLIDEINKMISGPQYLDFDPDDEIVHKALIGIATGMLKDDDTRLKKSEAKNICDALLAPRGHSKSLLPRLLDENLLVSDNNQERETFIYFEFERMAHFWQAEALLRKHPTSESLQEALHDPDELGRLISESYEVTRNSGLLEAMIMMIPSHYGCEFIELLPQATKEDPYLFIELFQLWVQCLKWRSPENIDAERVLSIIRGTRVSPGCWSSLIDLFISVGPIPNHPMNALFLHNWLVQKSMPDRDEYWTVELHNHYGSRTLEEPEQYAINVQLDWIDYATKPVKRKQAVQLTDEVVDLTGTLLGWFLPSPNRELRDRTTKTLVKLYRHKPARLIEFLDRFLEVNDPYVVERALAVAYGCILVIDDTDCMQMIAEKIYLTIFQADNVPVHLLARDYAVGLVCYARFMGLLNDVAPTAYLPPFNSTYEEELLSESEIDQLYTEKNGEDRLGKHKWSSDFYDYILGLNHGNIPWISRRLSEPAYVNKQARIDRFANSLTQKQRTSFVMFEEARSQYSMAVRIGGIYRRTGIEDGEVPSHFDVGQDEKKAVASRRNSFIRSLGAKKRHLFVTEIEKLLKHSYDDKPEMDLKALQRWIALRILDLGWELKKFRNHESLVDFRRSRYYKKTERIYKKYQWIAYWELLARIADNFQFTGDEWRGSAIRFKGVWQMSYDRDIDPSLLIEKTCANYRHLPVWWAPIDYLPSAVSLPSKESIAEWLRDPEQFPNVENLLCVTDSEGTEWVALWGTYSVEVKLPHFGKDADVSAYIDMRSYLVKQDDVAEVRGKLFSTQKNEIDGRPYNMRFDNAFMGELFWSDAYNDHCESDPNPDWRPVDKRDENSIKVLPTTDTYTREGSGYDNSLSDSIELPIPCRWLAREMGLRWSGHGSEFLDSAGVKVMYSPAVNEPGPNVFLCRRDLLEDMLEIHALSLLHSIWGHKRAYWEGINHEEPGRNDYNYAAVAESMKIEPMFEEHIVKTY